MAKLSVVATPIGNLEDITLRALRVLKEADLVLCEDTRVTKKLLAKYEIDTPTLSYHAHSGAMKVDKILDLLRDGQSLSLVTDAGTPGVSDPGSELVAAVRQALPEVAIEAIPGPSAVAAALSVVGFPATPFVFLGFPPQKKGRATFFNQLGERPETLVLYESPHRLEKALTALAERLPERRIAVVRELTKIYESVKIGTAVELTAYFAEHADKVRGEVVILIESQRR